MKFEEFDFLMDYFGKPKNRLEKNSRNSNPVLRHTKQHMKNIMAILKETVEKYLLGLLQRFLRDQQQLRTLCKYTYLRPGGRN